MLNIFLQKSVSVCVIWHTPFLIIITAFTPTASYASGPHIYDHLKYWLKWTRYTDLFLEYLFWKSDVYATGITWRWWFKLSLFQDCLERKHLFVSLHFHKIICESTVVLKLAIRWIIAFCVALYTILMIFF